MTEPINLAQLRLDATSVFDDGSRNHGQTTIWPEDLLALIDIAEAAHQAAEVFPELHARKPTCRCEVCTRLREALARTTTNP